MPLAAVIIAFVCFIFLGLTMFIWAKIAQDIENVYNVLIEIKNELVKQNYS